MPNKSRSRNIKNNNSRSRIRDIKKEKSARRYKILFIVFCILFVATFIFNLFGILAFMNVLPVSKVERLKRKATKEFKKVLKDHKISENDLKEKGKDPRNLLEGDELKKYEHLYIILTMVLPIIEAGAKYDNRDKDLEKISRALDSKLFLLDVSKMSVEFEGGRMLKNLMTVKK